MHVGSLASEPSPTRDAGASDRHTVPLCLERAGCLPRTGWEAEQFPRISLDSYAVTERGWTRAQPRSHRLKLRLEQATSIRSWTPQRVSSKLSVRWQATRTSSDRRGLAHRAGLHQSDAAYRDPDSGVLPQFEIIVLSGGRRIIEFDHLNADDNRYVTEMIEGTIIQIGDAQRGSVHGGRDRLQLEHTNGQHRITGTFENTTHPTLTNGDDYRVLFTQARKGADGSDGADGAAWHGWRGRRLTRH